MDKNANCFSIYNGGEVNEHGIPFEEGIIAKPERRIDIGDRWVSFHRPFPIVWPNGARMTRAALFWNSRYPVLADAPDEYDAILVHVKAHDLRFSFEPLAPGLSFWAGGDGPIHPAIQSGAHTAENKAQLFEVGEGESIFLVDTRGAAIELGCVDRQPVFTSVDVASAARFLLERAKATTSIPALDWALHNLAVLKETGCRDDTLNSALIQVRQRRAEA